MRKVLITGATGNVGKEVIRYVSMIPSDLEIVVGVRNIEKAKHEFAHGHPLHYKPFDFEDKRTFSSAFENINILFLLRPPHIARVEAVFKPLLETAKQNGVENIVFLSVQGAEKSKIIPHNKIERLVRSLGFNYIFIRPGYFMQNLTTTLLPEILDHRTITLPAGDAKFNWIDVENIGEASARLIQAFEKYRNNIYVITGLENKSFSEVTRQLTAITGSQIDYRSMNPFRFYFRKRKEGVNPGLAIVMTVLHYLPRFQKEPVISTDFKKLTGKEPNSLETFIQREKETFTAVD